MSTTTYATAEDELSALNKEDAALQRDLDKIGKARTRIWARVEKLRLQQFNEARDRGDFALDTMTPANFKALTQFANTAGDGAWKWARDLMGKVHKRIKPSGSYRSDTYQEVFDLSLSYRQEIDDALLEAVKKVSLLVRVVGETDVYWSLFDRRLSRDGIHEMIVYPEDWTARVQVTSYGREKPEDRIPLTDALRIAAAEHYYDGGPSGDDD